MSKITAEDYFRITDGYSKKIPSSFNFWYKYSEFGEYFLRKICLEEDIEINPDNWYTFIPVLKRVFVTYTEYKNIMINTAFLKGDLPYMGKETPDFMLHLLLRERDLPFDPMKISYKRFFKMYLYTIGDKYIASRRQMRQMKGKRYHG